MPGIFDNFYGTGGGNGLLPFGDRWAEVIAAMQNGQFDPQGQNFGSDVLTTMPGQETAPQAGPTAFAGMAPDPFAFLRGGGGPSTAMAYQPEPGGPPAPQGGPPMRPPVQMAPQQAQAGPGFGDRLQAAGASFFNAGSPMQALGGLIGGLVTGQRQDPMGIAQQGQQEERLALYQALKAKGVPDKEIMAALSSPAYGKALIGSLFKDSGSSSDITEYEYAKKQGFQGGLQDWIANKRAGAGEYGLQPIFGVDAEGNPSIAQLGKSGTAAASKLPPGFKISKDALKLDAGTHWVILDPITRQPVSTIPKDIAGKERQEKIGADTGTATVALPQAISDAELISEQITKVINHPGKKYGTGAVLGHFPAVAGDQADFVERVNQIKGGSFVQGVQKMRGLGALTEAEGTAVLQSVARLSRAKSEKDFDTALNDINEIMQRGVAVLRQRAGQSGGAPASSGNNLKKKYGLE